MPRNEVRVVVIFEDDAHRSFLVQLVDHLGLKPVRFLRCGDCNGVLRQFEAEIQTTRPRMKYQPNLGLLVAIDADRQGVQARVSQLQERLAVEGARGPQERIAYVVPALEIETWYVHLCVPAERPIDEGRDYKPTDAWTRLASNLGRAAREAVGAWPEEAGRVDPASLTAARAELRRLG